MRIPAQTLTFTTASGAASLLSAAAKIVLAGVLTVEAFGVFAFANSFLGFAALFFEFGLFLPAARMMAKAESDRASIVGAALQVYLPVGAALAVTVFAVSFGIDSWSQVDAGHALRVVAPLAFVYAFPLVALQLAQGSDRLHVYSITTALSQALFVVALLVFGKTAGHLTSSLALVLQSLSFLVGGLVCAFWLRPVFVGARRHWRRLIQGAREYGFAVYTGRVLSIGTYNMDVLMLGALTDPRSVALYTLAAAIASGAGLPVTGFANALFPRMARERRLVSRWLTATWLWGALGLFLTWLLAGPFLRTFLPSSYLAATAYIVPLALAQAIRGVTSIYNSYLASQGAGRQLRNAGLVLTVSNLVLNFALIPPFGATGAAWASALALTANLVAHAVACRGLIRRAKLAKDVTYA